MIEHLTYADLAVRLGVTAEAARALAKRLRLQRQRGNDGKARVVVDLAEVQHKAMPARTPAGDHPVAVLKARIEALQAELAEMEEENATQRAMADERREDFVRERDRADKLMAELLKATSDLMSAKEAAARLGGELAAFKARPWWRRLAG
jgi:chromosome segregation ATPase